MPLMSGRATVADDALLAIVEGAVAQIDGARIDRPGRVTRVLPGRRGGIEWQRDGGSLRIQVDVVARYGRVLPDLADEVKRAVAAAVAGMTGLEVRAVDVHISGVERGLLLHRDEHPHPG